jgi:hypothetical protein
MDLVRFRCVKDGSKLRVRVISPGYNTLANCQFPRNIRADGAEYTVPREDVSFNENAQMKFFYRVKAKNIRRIDEVVIAHIYEAEDSLCVVCMDAQTDVVFAPCGHFCCCSGCGRAIGNKCPICRANITRIVNRDQIAI